MKISLLVPAIGLTFCAVSAMRRWGRGRDAQPSSNVITAGARFVTSRPLPVRSTRVVLVSALLAGGCTPRVSVPEPAPEVHARMNHVTLAVSASAAPSWYAQDDVKVGRGRTAADTAKAGA